MVGKLGSNNNSAKQRQVLFSELIRLEDTKYGLEKELSKVKKKTNEESKVVTKLQEIQKDIEEKAREIENANMGNLGKMKSLEDISGEIWAGKPGTTGEHCAIVDEIVDGMFEGLEENESILDEEIELCFENLLKVTEEEE